MVSSGEAVKVRILLSRIILVLCIACVSRVTCHSLDRRYVTLEDLKQFAQVQSMDLVAGWPDAGLHRELGSSHALVN